MARILGVSKALLYYEVPGVSGRPVAPRGRTDKQRARVEEVVARATELLADPKQTISGVAKALGVSRVTLYQEIPGLVDRPKANAGRSPRQRQSADDRAAVTR
ncbi:helix-turn-helix domain-containing protein [Streptacidiphilus sp. PB12-B1b]|uniref:helix-turn-helix domain-containing protein n=1 Tax=Streptacidiphilus sp. PB12-B1b TaxID=2705012 RepID=UPI0015F78800|nr:helix-turn-helix domain-containing protein [Streptacidiphilus sp. PB12-B1b]QMU76869.1 helix-turn-helix domain-containing protein [Streptacidiphilus sp. PB12-B1b]